MQNFKKDTLAGKSALITGAGGFLGPRHAIALSRAGAKVFLLDVNKEGLDSCEHKLVKENPSAIFESVICDITSLESVEKLAINLDNDSNGKISAEECEAHGADNVMFWTSWSSSSRSTGRKQNIFSNQQINVLKYSQIPR